MKTLVILLSFFIFNFVSLLGQKDSCDSPYAPGRFIFLAKVQIVNTDFGILRSVNDELLGSLPFDAELTDDFPARPMYKLELNLSPFKSGIFSIVTIFHSSGSRVSYADYSGLYTSDIVFSAFGVGAGYTNFFSKKTDIIKIGFNVDLGFMSKEYTFKTTVRIGDETEIQGQKYNESSVYVQPGLIVAFNYKAFMIGLNLNYMMDFNGRFMDDRENVISYRGFRPGLVFGLNSNVIK
ncbi:MAG: hypothetical protein PF588_03635 [Candidatus Kapabacteria bacterium]|jgi:hypothetical protein|nr:hypothetical protein [Candidatus Kapabacteria bacterium]